MRKRAKGFDAPTKQATPRRTFYLERSHYFPRDDSQVDFTPIRLKVQSIRDRDRALMMAIRRTYERELPGEPLPASPEAAIAAVCAKRYVATMGKALPSSNRVRANQVFLVDAAGNVLARFALHAWEDSYFGEGRAL